MATDASGVAASGVASSGVASSGVASSGVAVCMTGRTRSLAYTSEVVMPSYVARFERPGMDLFVVLGDRLLARGDPPIDPEEARLVFEQSRNLRSFHLSSLNLRVPVDWGHSMCKHFEHPRRIGQPGTAVQMLKLPAAFAAVVREERSRGRGYGFVVRTRPDLAILYPLPTVAHLYTTFALVQPGKKSAAVLSGLPPPIDEAAAPAPRETVAADVITWDDQFAIARRDAAEALMVGSAQTASECHNASIWASACGISLLAARRAVDARQPPPCCPVRTIAPHFGVVVRECGDLKRSGCVSVPWMRGAPCACFETCTMTTWHWENHSYCKKPGSRVRTA
jgi:hypothetical protein